MLHSVVVCVVLIRLYCVQCAPAGGEVVQVHMRYRGGSSMAWGHSVTVIGIY